MHATGTLFGIKLYIVQCWYEQQHSKVVTWFGSRDASDQRDIGLDATEILGVRMLIPQFFRISLRIECLRERGLRQLLLARSIMREDAQSKQTGVLQQEPASSLILGQQSKRSRCKDGHGQSLECGDTEISRELDRGCLRCLQILVLEHQLLREANDGGVGKEEGDCVGSDLADPMGLRVDGQ